MPDHATLEPQMLHPEQVSVPTEQEKTWLRQKHEPANWYMRFKCYLDLGPKRSLRAVVAADPLAKKATESNKKQPKNEPQKTIAEVSVPGAWSRAAKVWSWKERAQAYDLKEQEKDAQIIRTSANSMPHASRAYRVISLDYCARILRSILEQNTSVRMDKISHYLSVIARYQSVMRDIEREMQGLDGVTINACDSAAWSKIELEIAQNKQKQETRKTPDYEQNRGAFEAIEKLEKQEKKLTTAERELLRRGLPLKK